MIRSIATPAAEPHAPSRCVYAAWAGALFYLAQAGALTPLTFGALSAWPELAGRRRFSELAAPLVCALFAEAGRWIGLGVLSGRRRRLSALCAVVYGGSFGAAELLRAALIPVRTPAPLRFALPALPINPAGPLPAWSGTLFFEAGVSALAGAGVAQGRAAFLPALALSRATLNVALAALIIHGHTLSAQLASVAAAALASVLAAKLWRRRSARQERSAPPPAAYGDTGAVVVEQLVCAYDTGFADAGKTQLGPLSFTAKAGRMLALLGPNGAGKTTTLRVLSGLLKPRSGKVCVFGADIAADGDARIGALAGLAPEEPGLYPRMRVGRYLEFFARLYHLPRHERAGRIAELMRLLELDPARRVRIGTLSKGERQKLALARALIHQPRLLLLDEPTAALDPKVARSVRRLIAGLKANACAVVIATHNLDEAQSLADELLILRRGRAASHIRQSGPPAEGGAPARFEVRLAPSACDAALAIEKLAHFDSVEEVTLAPESGPGEVVFSFLTATPLATNPAVLNMLLGMGLKPYALTRSGLSVEQVYASEGEMPARGESSASADPGSAPEPERAASASAGERKEPRP